MRRRTTAVKPGGPPPALSASEDQRVFAVSFLCGALLSPGLSGRLGGQGVPLWVGVQLGGSLAGKDSSTASSTSSSASSTGSRGALPGSDFVGLPGDGLFTMVPPSCASSDASGSQADHRDQIGLG